MTTTTIKVTKPVVRKRREDAGHDVISGEKVLILARSSSLVKTYLKVQVPKDHVGLLWSRSGLSVKYRIEVGAGCIDEGYEGDVNVHLYNHSDQPFSISPGDRIAQILFMPINKDDTEEVNSISEDTDRGEKGFGSSDSN